MPEQVPYNPVPTEKPTGAPDDYARVNVTPDMFGAQIGQASEKFGTDLQQASQDIWQAAEFHDQVVADDSTNQLMDLWNKRLRGDPNKTVIGPDGQPTQDTGYLGLSGRAALDAWPQVQKDMDQDYQTIRSNLSGPALLKFDQDSRRYRQYVDNDIGQHADQQQQVWAENVEKSAGNLALEHIANNADNDQEVIAGTHDLINARLKTAQRMGATEGDDLWNATVEGAKKEALKAQLDAIAVTRPDQALDILNKNRTTAGTDYDNLANSFRSRAEQMRGNEAGDYYYNQAGHEATEQNANAQGKNSLTPFLIKNFEGFTPNAKWDVNHYRAGYGSDTITKADGTVISVTPGTTVTPEDAERDLQRRIGDTENTIKGQIGEDAWGKLSPNAQSALVSVAYNYGRLPDRIIPQAKSGDPQALAQAVLGLQGDNGGVNASRRLQEAEIITGAKADAYRLVNDDPSLNDQEKQHAITRINQLNAQAQTMAETTAAAQKMASDNAMNGYVSTMISSGAATPDMIQSIAADPYLTAEAKENLYTFAANRFAFNAGQNFGPGYADAYKRLLLPPGDPNRINDLNGIVQMGAPGGQLTPQGVDRLSKVYGEINKNPDQAAVNRAKSSLLDGIKDEMAKTQIVPGMGPISTNLAGDKIFKEEFVPQYEAAYDAWIKAGKNPWEFLTKDKAYELMDRIYPPSKRNQDVLNSGETATPGELVNETPPPAPQGVPAQGWTNVLGDAPKYDSAGNPYPAGEWGRVVDFLRTHPTPEVKKAFDDTFGKHISMNADQILQQLGVEPPPSTAPTGSDKASGKTIRDLILEQ